jgi:predicted phage terminase large subunit-like protein
MGAIFARTLQKQTRTRILQVHNTQNKMTRIIMASSVINNYFQFVNNETSYYQRFMDNVYSFSQEGKNKNDDAPDCLAGLVIFIRSMFRHIEI